MTEQEAICGSTHRHYKGGLYRFLYFALHTETGEELVIYQHVWPHAQGVFARPRDIFFGNLPDGRKRFAPIGEVE